VSDVVSTGIEGLDTVLHGGLPRGRVHLIQGRTGSGKTTLALQFALFGVARGERCAYLSFAETESEIVGIARSHGWSTTGLDIFYQGDAGTDRPPMQTVLHPGEAELPAILDRLIKCVEAARPARLVIDSLAELRILAREVRWYRHELMRLRHRLETLECTSLVLDTTVAEEAATLLGGVIELDRVTPQYGPDRRRLHVAKMRGHDFQTGFHDVRLRTGGLNVYPRLVSAETRRQFNPTTSSTGLPKFDTMLGGGLDQGSAVLLLGASGTGKSTLAMQCAVAAAEHGQAVLAVIFDERLQTVFQRAAAVGIPLEDHVKAGRIVLHQRDPAEVTPGEFAENIRREAAERNVRLVMIDSLNAYLYAMPDERFLNVHLHELLAYLSQRGITSVMIAAERSLGGIDVLPAELDVSYLADTVVLLELGASNGKRGKTITVRKRRAGEHEEVVREFRITCRGLAIGDVVSTGGGTRALNAVITPARG
jgi:circadian clock protein KaiC